VKTTTATVNTTAYSYIRFSNPEQAAGDSLRRQSERASEYSGRRGWKLDDTLTLRDLGVSAFRGMNATVGNLRVFLDAIKSSKVVPGSALIVESFDRISRQGIDEGYDLVKSILKAGVKIVTLSPEREFDVDATKSLSKGALEIQLILERAAEESERKSERVGSAWARKQREAGQKAVTRRVPVWLTVVGGEGKKIKDTAPGEVRIVLDATKVKIVHRIFALAIAGDGAMMIARKMNAENVPYIGRETVKGRTVAWGRTLVYQILTSRATIGEYTPYISKSRKRQPGEPIAGYYPAVIDEATYYQAQASIATRARAGRGRRGKRVNLLAGLLVNARDGGTLGYAIRTGRGKTYIIATNTVERGQRDWSHFSGAAIESALLTKLAELSAADITNGDTAAAKRLAEIDANVARIDALRAAWRGKMNDPAIVDVVAAKLAELAKEREETVKEREKVKGDVASATSGESLREIVTLADVLSRDNSDETRLKVRAALRSVVETIHVMTVSPSRTRKLAAVRVQFRSGGHRDYVIGTRSATKAAAETWEAESFADAGLPDGADLRDADQAKKLEALLVKHTAKK